MIKYMDSLERWQSLDCKLVPLSKETKTAVSELAKFRARMAELEGIGAAQKAKFAEGTGDLEKCGRDFAVTRSEQELVTARVEYLVGRTRETLRADVLAALSKLRKDASKSVEDYNEALAGWREAMSQAVGPREARSMEGAGAKPKTVRDLLTKRDELGELVAKLQGLAYWIDEAAWRAGPGAIAPYDNGLPRYRFKPRFDENADALLEALAA